jgi:hypothetical protein
MFSPGGEVDNTRLKIRSDGLFFLWSDVRKRYQLILTESEDVMRNLTFVVILAGLAIATCCPCPPAENVAVKAGEDDQCEGWGTERILGNGSGPAEELRCNGDCPDGSPCRPMYNADSTRQWCGCPGDPEPAECHLVRMRDTSFQWIYICSDPCPDPADVCRLVRRLSLEDTTRYTVKCECIFPGDED